MKVLDVGRISSVYPDKGTARIVFKGYDNFVSREFIVLNRNIYPVEDERMPRVGAQVLCAVIPNTDEGFILGSYEVD